MARTTFSGPVRSLNGFVSAGPGAAQTITADNTTLALSIFPAPTVDSNGNPTGAITPGNAGVINVYGSDNATGAGQLTLPAVLDTVPSSTTPPTDPTAPDQQNQLGAQIIVISAFDLANDLVIKPSGADVFTGYAMSVDSAGLTKTFLATPGDTTFTWNGGTTGGDIDSIIKCTIVSANTWYVEAVCFGAAGGAGATPFSA
jgi:hypothetical protein